MSRGRSRTGQPPESWTTSNGAPELPQQGRRGVRWPGAAVSIARVSESLREGRPADDDDGPVNPCPECGAPALPLSRQELFERLLVLDYRQEPPWGPLHGVVVACFFLQHPTSPTAPASGGDVQWTIVHRYLTGGQPALDAFVPGLAAGTPTDSGARPGLRGPPARSVRSCRTPPLPGTATVSTAVGLGGRPIGWGCSVRPGPPRARPAGRSRTARPPRQC